MPGDQFSADLARLDYLAPPAEDEPDAHEPAGEDDPTPKQRDADPRPQSPAQLAAALPLLDIGAWQGQPVPEREWIVLNRIVRRNVALLSGVGGTGKSLLTMQLCVAAVIGREWVGSLPAVGPAIYVNAEDDERELHYRFAAIANHFGTSFADLKPGGLNAVSLVGRDAALGAPDRAGYIRPTPLFGSLRQHALAVCPVVVALDTAADLFIGNENDRSQVRQFIGLLRGLALDADCAVLLVSHPSVGGIATDTGLSGSTAWHNGPRTRLYFKSPNGDGGEPESDLRELIVKKSNYGPDGEHVRVRWKDGVFVSLGTPSTIERAAAEQKADDVFLQLLRRFTQQGQRVTVKPGTSYAPVAFVGHPDSAGVSKQDLTRSMQRLLDAGKIRVEEDGPPSHRRSRLVFS